MSDLSELQRAALESLTEGDDLSCLTVRQAFAYGVALGTMIADPPIAPHPSDGEYQSYFRPIVDDLSLEVQEAMGWEPES